jgi:SAM-dependent methyltransferase
MSADHVSWEQAVVQFRSQPQNEDLVRAAYYDDPLIAAAERYWRSPEWAAIRRLLPSDPRARVLDVGAGRGIASFAFARDGFDVTALEPDPSAIVGAGAIRALAHDASLRIHVVESASESLPFPNEQFSIVFARAVLHHTRDLRNACQEFYRVLKPGGMLIAIREHVLSRAEDLQAFYDAHPLHRLYGGEHAYLLDDYIHALEMAEFALDQVIAPLDSDINLAPLTAQSAQAEIARRVGEWIPGGSTPVRLAFRIPGAWRVARRLLRAIDHRPGRLYSFVARRK